MSPRNLAPTLGAASFLILAGCSTSVTVAPVAPPAPTATATATSTSVPIAPMVAPSEEEHPYLRGDFLLSLIPPDGEAEPNSREVWKSLLNGLASDPESVAVLGKLLGGWPATIERLDLADATTEALRAGPPEGSAFVLRYAGQGSEPRGRKERDGLVGRLLFGLAARLDGTPPHNGPGRTVVAPGRTSYQVRVPGNVPDPDEMVLLLVHDYLLRRHPGWTLQGDIPKPGQAGTPPEARKQVDDQIEAMGTLHRQYYGEPKGQAAQGGTPGVSP